MCKLEKRFSSDPDVKGLYIKLAFINIIDVISNEYEIKCKDKLSSFLASYSRKKNVYIFETINQVLLNFLHEMVDYE